MRRMTLDEEAREAVITELGKRLIQANARAGQADDRWMRLWGAMRYNPETRTYSITDQDLAMARIDRP